MKICSIFIERRAGKKQIEKFAIAINGNVVRKAKEIEVNCRLTSKYMIHKSDLDKISKAAHSIWKNADVISFAGGFIKVL